MNLRALLLGSIPLVFALGASGCADPVHDDEVAALGPEPPGEHPGPLHRPGQPCVVCHDGTGPASLVFSFGGTVYQNATCPVGAQGCVNAAAVGTTVQLLDAKGKFFTTVTNCAGNFFVQEEEFTPTYPVHTAVVYGKSLSALMLTHIGRDGSCATCHTGRDTEDSVDHVYVAEQPFTFPPSGCP